MLTTLFFDCYSETIDDCVLFLKPTSVKVRVLTRMTSDAELKINVGGKKFFVRFSSLISFRSPVVEIDASIDMRAVYVVIQNYSALYGVGMLESCTTLSCGEFANAKIGQEVIPVTNFFSHVTSNS